MKKLKTFVLILVCLLSSTLLFACDKTVHVESVTLSETEIVLRPNEEKEISVNILPLNATNKNFEFVLTDDTCVSLTVNESDSTKATIKAKNNITGTFTTFLQAKSVDGDVLSNICKIVVYTNKTKLFTPQNLKYDAQNQIISWDEIESSSGYMLKINIEGIEEKPEIFCATNQYKIDDYFNKKISVQIKSVGDNIIYTDSDYSEKTFTFLQLSKPQNLKNDGNFVKFDKVENADSYQILVYENQVSGFPKYTRLVLDTDFDPQTGIELEFLQNSGKKYFVGVVAKAESTTDVVVYESKCDEYIEINKIATPIVNNSNLKFTYSSKTISWTANPNASGYKLNRYKDGILDKEYNFVDNASNTNFLVIDTELDKLEAGVYSYTLIILGNGTTYLDSNESDALNIEKLSAPVLKIENGVLCWDEVLNVGGYSLDIKNINVFDLSAGQTTFSLKSTTNEDYDAGTYNFKITSVGNGTNTITSEPSIEYSFDKLERPQIPTLNNNQFLNFDVLDIVENIKVYLTRYSSINQVDFNQEISLSNFVQNASNKYCVLDMLNGEYKGQKYPDGIYKVYFEAYAQNHLYSEPSKIFEFEKLSNNQTLVVSNGEVSYSIPQNVQKTEVYLSGIKVYDQSPENFDINTISNFEAGKEYYLQLRFYPQPNTNVVISNLTEKVLIKKILSDTIRLSVENGEIVASASITGKFVFEVKIVGSDETTKYYSISQMKFEENNVYSIKMYFEGDNYYLNSDYSNEIIVTLMNEITDLEIDNGILSFTSNFATSYKAVIKSGSFEHIVDNIAILSSYSESESQKPKISFSLENLISSCMPIDYNTLDGNFEIYVSSVGCESDKLDRAKYSNLSNNSNSVFASYSLQNQILDLNISGDTLSFSACNAEDYFAVLKLTDEQQINLNELSSFVVSDNVTGNISFSLTELIKTVYPNDYSNLKNNVQIYVKANDIIQPFVVINNHVNFKTVENSKSIYVNILSTPTNFAPSKLFDLVENSNMINDDDIGLNKLYFDCTDDVDMFELNYTNSLNQTKTKMLTTNNYLKLYKQENGINTYQINTSFLEAGTYSFSLKSVCKTSGGMDNSINDYVYNYNSFDAVNLQNITKLNAVSEVLCQNQKIIFVDDNPNQENCIYLTVVNGKVIYDDVLGDGKDLNDVMSMVSLTDLDQTVEAIKLINKFKSKERIMPASFGGTNKVACLKLLIPELPENKLQLTMSLSSIMTGGMAIQSDVSDYITVTRLETVKPVLRNGILEFGAIQNAESYTIYKTKLEDGKVVADFDNVVANINASSELKFDLYSYFAGSADTYNLTIIANTSKENYLSSFRSNNINFEILATPTLYVEQGKLNWNSISNSAGYKLEVYKDGALFDTFVFDKTILSYDAMKTSKGKVVESANYEFRITALGEIELNSLGEIKDETVVMKSLTSPENACKAFKLQTPQKAFVEDGMLCLTQVNSNSGVSYYNLIINNKETEINRNNLKFELSAQYGAGNYNFYYQAVGMSATLSSNFSDDFDAIKLEASSAIYVSSGELYWDSISAENYNNGNGNVVYSFSLNKETSVYSEQTTATAFEISKKDIIPYGLYSFEVKALGDNYYYLNSNKTILSNVVKLANISDIRIEKGTLTWTNPKPSDIVGLPANSKASPNGYKIVISWGQNKEEFSLEDGTTTFVLGDRFEDGSYSVSIQNIGSKQSGDYNYTSSKIVSSSVYKLIKLEDLNIADGLNLNWTNPNIKLVQEFVVNIKHTLNDATKLFSGIIPSTNSKIRFEDLLYYTNDNGENILVLSSNENIVENNGELYFEENKLNKLSGEGKFEVNVCAYGNDKFISSDASNTITIVRPPEVTNLHVTHGKVSWTGSEEANGYILTLTRYTLNALGEKVQDEEYNNNYSVVYVNKTYYNLTDVNFYYNISVRAYSLVTEGEEQKMASKPVEIYNYLFNSFSSGNGSKTNPYLITDELTLGLIKYNNVAFYKITNNINIQNKWTPLFSNMSFAGNLDGDGKTISGLSIVDSYDYSGLLGYIGSDTVSDDRVVNGVRQQFIPEDERVRIGRVENIDFNNISITAGINVGVVAGLNEGTIYNINIRNAKIISNSEILLDVGASYKSIYSGLVVAINKGKIEKCSVQNNNYQTKVEPLAKTTLYSGGVCAINDGEIIYSYIDANVYGTIAGGICAINNNKVEFCAFYGTISCANFVSNKSTLVARAGGICAINSENATVSNVIVDNNLFGTGEGGITNLSTTNIQSNIVYIGGLIGDNKGNCFNSYVKIDLFNRSSNDVDCEVCYLFGYNSNNTLTNNYYVLSDTTMAKQMLKGQVIDEKTNGEIQNHSQELLDTFNQKNSDNSNYEWRYIENYKFNEEIIMQINIGFVKIERE